MRVYKDINFNDIGGDEHNKYKFAGCTFINVVFSGCISPNCFESCVFSNCIFEDKYTKDFIICLNGSYTRFYNCVFSSIDVQMCIIGNVCNLLIDNCIIKSKKLRLMRRYLDSNGSIIFTNNVSNGRVEFDNFREAKRIFIVNNTINNVFISGGRNIPSLYVANNQIESFRISGFGHIGEINKKIINRIVDELKNGNIKRFKIDKVTFDSCDLSGIDFHTTFFFTDQMYDVEFYNCNIDGCDFSKCNIVLSDSNFQTHNARICFKKTLMNNANFGNLFLKKSRIREVVYIYNSEIRDENIP